MPTATQIIEQALGELGSKAVGQSVSGDELQDCFDRLNAMVDAWRGQRLYSIATSTVSATLAANAISATIGLGGLQTFTAEAPSDIAPGSFYRFGDADYEIRPISFAEYQAIGLKTISAAGPAVVMLTPAFPVGTLNFWPAPVQPVQVFLAVSSRLTTFVDLTTNYIFAPGYQRALFLSLAEELAAPYQSTLSAMTVRNASAARRLIKRENSNIPLLSLDGRLPGLGARGGFGRGYA